MGEIPEDVMRAAEAEIAKGDMAFITVARAILAERKRCADVARKEAKIYDTPHGSQPAYLAAYMIAERIESGQ